MADLAKRNFINKVNKMYNNDYIVVDYVDNYTPISITCKTHGEFIITPRTLLKGTGCPKCQYKKFNLFLAKAELKFQKKYKYNPINDFDFDPYQKIEIECPKHGIFKQTTYNHIRGNGCPKCSYELESEKVSLGYYNFTQKAKNIHGDKYNYDNVEYINNRTKVEIKCPKHGIFKQTPHDHLMGSGCSKCKGI
jgi:Zn finger protein HypA/HybF involved in hydrogenase expression